MSNQNLQPGDVVELKSGGPPMTIGRIDEHLNAKCYWFEGKTSKEEDFKLVALMKYVKPKAEVHDTAGY